MACQLLFLPHSKNVSPTPPLQQQLQQELSQDPLAGSPHSFYSEAGRHLGGSSELHGILPAHGRETGTSFLSGKVGVGGDSPKGSLRALPPVPRHLPGSPFSCFLAGARAGRVMGLMPSAQLVFGAGGRNLFALPKHHVFLPLTCEGPRADAWLTTEMVPAFTPREREAASHCFGTQVSRGLKQTS